MYENLRDLNIMMALDEHTRAYFNIFYPCLNKMETTIYGAKQQNNTSGHTASAFLRICSCKR